jgi:nucleoside 2-deoxyribosyltransferase
MRLYLAAAYGRKNEIRKYAQQATDEGLYVTSRWLEEPHDPNTKMSEVTDEFLESVAVQDFDDIDAADVLVFWAEDQDKQPPRGGRHVEMGIAIGRNIPIIVIGNPENVFHHLPKNYISIEFFDTWESALEFLKAQDYWGI